MAGANCPLRLCDQGVTGRGLDPSGMFGWLVGSSFRSLNFSWHVSKCLSTWECCSWHAEPTGTVSSLDVTLFTRQEAAIKTRGQLRQSVCIRIFQESGYWQPLTSSGPRHAHMAQLRGWQGAAEEFGSLSLRPAASGLAPGPPNPAKERNGFYDT